MSRLSTLLRLGPGSVARVAAYRLSLKAGIHPVQRLSGATPAGPLFRPLASHHIGPPRTDLPWTDQPYYFGWLTLAGTGAPPRWRAHPLNSDRQILLKSWWKIPDFDPAIGDIKFVWEASRFEWVVSFAKAAATGNSESLTQLNDWLTDWWQENPPYLGPNWKCGQEASLRVLRLLLAAEILGQLHQPETALVETIALHLRRIQPTLAYAKAQKNNHATSEAAALWIGGAFLKTHNHALGTCAMSGKTALERALAQLVLPDGSFSQNSSNYHRFMLDTVIVAEVLRRVLGAAALSTAAQLRIGSALHWLEAMTDPVSGQAFHLGHNDSAYLLPYPKGTARDFRYTIALGKALFTCAPKNGVETPPLPELFPEKPTSKTSDRGQAAHFPDGGYTLLVHGPARSLLRLPIYRFRPSHCDALHVDLVVCGRNIFRDCGTASYSDAALPDLSATSHHNTIQFDDDDQMPRLSRFLWGDWLSPAGPIHHSDHTAAAAYVDRKGRRHDRQVRLAESHLEVIDTLSGNFSTAILRWHLLPGKWEMVGAGTFMYDDLCLSLSADSTMTCRLVEAVEAPHYGRISTVPMVEATVCGPATLTSTLTWLVA